MWGKRITDLRDKSGHSQGDLAKLLGVAQTTVSYWEKAAYPPLDAITQVCRIYNIPLWRFFRTDDIQNDDYVSLGLDDIDVEIIKKLKQLPKDKQEKFLISVSGIIDLL